MLKQLLLLFFMLATAGVRAEVGWVQLGVNGLTCSQCTRSVEMSLRKLDFVADVQMNLEKTEGRITFQKGVTVHFEKIAEAVTNAGFSVRFLKAGITLPEPVEITGGIPFKIGTQHFCFPGTASQKLRGEIVVTFLGKMYMPAREMKSWRKKLVCSSPPENETLYYIAL